MNYLRTCTFCKIIENNYDLQHWDLTARHPGLVVVSFAPLEPVAPGHRLFVPSVHVSMAHEAPVITGLVFETAARYAEQAMKDFNLIVNGGPEAGQTVFHLHVHYVPRRDGDGLSLPWTKVRALDAPVPA